MNHRIFVSCSSRVLFLFLFFISFVFDQLILSDVVFGFIWKSKMLRCCVVYFLVLFLWVYVVISESVVK